ncbi:MAG: hypothetical protein EWV55_10185 [Microcystis viridis Mv_BB_P_19951000_S69]|uniref:Uncharacterized protein n=1 Tax=Microcystis viridis Mv_BB_P_19951000_S68D TaxID=2486270 RepID=A0A552HIR4_MICVR|nr:hypothetical protein [Microcystis aeruginosa]TRU71141.1 MAG: hypothetical protein EWV77_15560 [Microcystis viridis Mv_BB_P_19951000_S68D]TRU74576.1 MAG: hypothetical protein EWV47_10490 [Microcystis viridis Mv_BB_P_19951000_S68]TRU74859.1 MAG: hypothetical protein EWV55_10185 [Microcystis viridis Mv_BB_P_19951000_S69]TRU89463.1 MAG: hypothetical protein EWV46_03740 [Microcystis viridis Mv_BB_P_19951000_S69D]MDB9421317.1 hypothetical protein [Microcystis aeruginosa CS-563/04]
MSSPVLRGGEGSDYRALPDTGNPSQERDGSVNLYFHRDGSTEMTGLNPLQKRILALMKVSESIYILPSPGTSQGD